MTASQPQSAEDRPVYLALRRRAVPLLGKDAVDQTALTPEDKAWLELEEKFGSISAVIETPPGSGKSRDATEFVTQAWDELGLKGLYLMLSHEAIKQRLDKLEKDGKAYLWSHWKRHAPGCERNKHNQLGYLGHGRCTCGRPPREALGPTLAPIDHILPNLPVEGEPRVKAVNDRVIGEGLRFRQCPDRLAETQIRNALRIWTVQLGNLARDPHVHLGGPVGE